MPPSSRSSATARLHLLGERRDLHLHLRDLQQGHEEHSLLEDLHHSPRPDIQPEPLQAFPRQPDLPFLRDTQNNRLTQHFFLSFW